MTGAYPANPSPEETVKILTILHNSNVNVIISLQEFGEDSSFTKYKDIYGVRAQYYQFPIKDKQTLPKDQLIYIINTICSIMSDPSKIIYFHCFGGHGRTGLIATLLLKFTYNLTNDQALDLWYTLHDTRNNPNIRKTGKPGRLTKVQLESLKEF